MQKDNTNDNTSVDKKLPSENIESDLQKEYGGQKGLEPTRYGDWEKNGRVSDF